MSEREQFERLKFERWASTLMLADIAQRIDGTYDDRETSDLWQAWQARAALDDERVRELEAKAFDEAAVFMMQEARSTPVGHEDAQRGASTFNWLKHASVLLEQEANRIRDEAQGAKE